MSLSTDEIIKIKQIASRKVKNFEINRYQYDSLYGHRYPLDDVQTIFENLNLKLSIQEIKILSVMDKFQITKETVLLVGKYLLLEQNVTSENAFKFGVFCLMWGYASQGYGVYRIKKIFDNPKRGIQFSENIICSMQYLQNDNLEQAYLCWENETHIKGLGEAFFTKILYFISKIINEKCPGVVIKDSFTSMNAATLFEIKRLSKRGVEYFLDYIYVIRVLVKEFNISSEKIEEFLFSNTKEISAQMQESEFLQYSFQLSNEFADEYFPTKTLTMDTEFDVKVMNKEENKYTILLVSDGKPNCELEKMTYDSAMGNVFDHFYSNQRNKIIIKANIEANKYQKDTPTYILTTGLGAISINTNIPYYNIPGEIAIKDKQYWKLYQHSLINILPSVKEGNRIQVSIVYYAGKSNVAFREGIIRLLKKIAEDIELKKAYEIHFCIYGGRQHVLSIWSGNWGNLKSIFDSLNNFNFQTLEIMKNSWIEENKNVSPFFVYY